MPCDYLATQVLSESSNPKICQIQSYASHCEGNHDVDHADNFEHDAHRRREYIRPSINLSPRQRIHGITA